MGFKIEKMDVDGLISSAGEQTPKLYVAYRQVESQL
jgi:hypothetical protein